MLRKVKSEKLKVRSGEGGQVLLIVILVIIVSLTIGLSLASRGITNLRTSTEEADSQKALAAAEAGIEKALQNTISSTGTLDISTYSTTVVSQDGETFLLNGGSLITQGEGADIWFAGHNSDGSINYPPEKKAPKHFHLYWGVAGEEACDPSDSSKWPAAIEVIVVSGDSASNITSTRYAYDYCNRGNNFSSAKLVTGVPPSPMLANFKIRTPQGENDLAKDIDYIIFMRVIPIYKSTVIGVSACKHDGGECKADLPSQGFQISSTGTSGTIGTTTGAANRKLTVFKGYQQTFLPYISYGLFVPTR